MLQPSEQAGYLAHRDTITGRTVLYEAAAQGLDAGGMRYAIVCEQHGCVGGDSSKRRAMVSLRHPRNFCEQCERELSVLEAQIGKMRAEAVAAGDAARVQLCDKALCGNERAFVACTLAIQCAHAQRVDELLEESQAAEAQLWSRYVQHLEDDAQRMEALVTHVVRWDDAADGEMIERVPGTPENVISVPIPLPYDPQVAAIVKRAHAEGMAAAKRTRGSGDQ